jgi:hypothetical protein
MKDQKLASDTNVNAKFRSETTPQSGQNIPYSQSMALC